MTLQFCIDIDNVIASTDIVMREVIRTHTQGRVSLSYEDIKEFDYCQCHDSFGGAVTREEWKEIHALFSEPRYLWRIAPTPGAIEGLRELTSYGRLHLATARLPKARRTTVEWLQEHDLPAHDLHFLSYGEKHASLRGFSGAVEDDYAQALSFATRANTPCVLLRHPWNESKPAAPGLSWAKDWTEVVKILLSIAA
jgi:uncharacterized HAD superfamily protein